MTLVEQQLLEQQRIDAVNQFQQLDFDLDENLQGLLQLASEICEAPAAFITLIDENNQWFKVRLGFEIQQMPREQSFCKYTILQNDVVVIPDILEDTRFSNHPMVVNAPNLRFYAAAPLTTVEGHNVGTMCIYDRETKTLNDSKRKMLGILGKQATHLMEYKLCVKMLNDKNKQVRDQNNALIKIAYVHAHEFRGPLSTMIGIMNIIKDENYNSSRELLMMMEVLATQLDVKIHDVVKSTELAKEMYVA